MEHLLCHHHLLLRPLYPDQQLGSGKNDSLTGILLRACGRIYQYGDQLNFPVLFSLPLLHSPTFKVQLLRNMLVDPRLAAAANQEKKKTQATIGYFIVTDANNYLV